MTRLLAMPGGATGRYEIPEGVTSIVGYAFSKTSLSEIVIADTVTSIEAGAFASCDDLDSVVFLGEAPSIADDAFESTTTTVYLPSGDPSWDIDMMLSYGGSIDWAIEGGMSITTQPVDAAAYDGESVSVAVKAVGEGLSYQWYVAEKGSGTFVANPSFRGYSYGVPMSPARNGRRVYCVVTDKYGNAIRSNTVTLSMKTRLKISMQPVDAAAYDGETVSVAVKAVGDGLRYQWYVADKGATAFTANPSFRGHSYGVPMSSARSGRRVYCVVTDKYGDSVRSDTVTLSMKTKLEILQQPKSVSAYSGKVAKVTVSVKGDGLTYKWYYANAGSTQYKYTGSFKGNTYSLSMSESRSRRKVYCVISDQYGNSVKTKTVSLKMRTKLELVLKPKSVTAYSGKTAKVTLSAKGDGLTYKWYYANAGSTKYTRTDSFKGTYYSVKMSAARSGRKVCCVITDKYGDSIRTDTVTLKMRTTLKVTKQPVSISVANGKTAKVTVGAQGDGLTYKWYYADGSTFKTTSTFKSNYYSIKMSSARSGRRVYCVITDKYCNSVKTNVVTLEMK